MSRQVDVSQRIETWRMLPYNVGPTDLHFRQSDALVRLSVQPTLWWHSTEQPTLIFGASQTDIDLSRCQAAGVLTVRRQAGGTAVYAAAGVLGLDLMMPAGHRLAYSDVLETYRWLGETWVTALSRLGLPAHLVSIEEARAATAPLPAYAPIRVACFGTLSPYEVTAQGRKLVGLAQVRRRNGVLLQSAIHRHLDADRLAQLLDMPRDFTAALRRAAVGLDELTDISDSELMGAFERSLETARGISLVEGPWTQQERAHAKSTRSA